MQNKGGIVAFNMFFIIIIFSISNINAGPYGYNDTMNLKYVIQENKIIYGYGDGIKYETSLRPKYADENWTADVRRKIVNKTWDEIEEEKELEVNQLIEELLEDKQKQPTIFEKIINFAKRLF